MIILYNKLLLFYAFKINNRGVRTKRCSYNSTFFFSTKLAETKYDFSGTLTRIQ